MKIFAERLKELRLENGLSAKQLGDKIGVADSTIVRWENEKIVPTIVYLKELALLFNVSADYLIGLEN